MNDTEVESEIQKKGLTAPRLSPERIDGLITAADYYVFPGTAMTVCCLTLQNGHRVIGESCPISSANFDRELGEKIAYANAREKIWGLEGYLIRDHIYRNF